LRLARLARGRWEKATTLPGRGGLDAGLHWAGGRLWLLYSSVVPEGWHLAELDAGGAPVADGVIPGPIDERPFLRLDGAEPTLVWSRDEFPRSAVGGERFLWEAPTGSTFRYMAFGDSITKGVEDECNQNCDANGANCGYPKRLPTSTYLNCAVNACQVVNKGKGGETTAQGVTRIQTVLEDNGPWDEVLLMEGTNDICWNDFSNNTIENNLETMESLATAAGVETLHASIIHICGDTCEPGFECPSSLPDPEGRVEDLRERIRDNLANVDPDTSHRWWSDPWSVLCPTQSCFNQHYADWGHPDCSGYDLMTDVFRDAILAKPEPGAPTAVGPVGTIADSSPTFEWDKEVPRDATWYQFQLDGPGGNLEDDWFAETAVCTGSDCTLGVGTLPDGAYTWRVRGRNAAGRSAWVETTFTIQTVLPPGPPTPVAPTGTIGDDRPEFTWLRETPTAATSYELEVSDEAGVILDQTYSPFLVCAGTTCTVDPFDLGDPLAAGDYSWRVRGANVAGAGPWTEPLAFTVIPGLLFTDGFESGDTTAWSEEQL
jgi:lysophospholipase L1-like esterase